MPEINSQVIDHAKGIVSDILGKMGVEGQINAQIGEYKGEENVVLNISTDEASILIGRDGEHMIALQHMARLMYKKTYDENIPLVIDINNYKKDKEEKLVSLARSVALRVRRTKEKEVLHPMASYDRFVIHNFLATEEDLETESEGRDPERCVVVKLAE